MRIVGIFSLQESNNSLMHPFCLFVKDMLLFHQPAQEDRPREGYFKLEEEEEERCISYRKWELPSS